MTSPRSATLEDLHAWTKLAVASEPHLQPGGVNWPSIIEALIQEIRVLRSLVDNRLVLADYEMLKKFNYDSFLAAEIILNSQRGYVRDLQHLEAARKTALELAINKEGRSHV